MTRKTNTVLIGLLGTILMGLSTWVLITLIEIQTIVSMMQNELMKVMEYSRKLLFSMVDLNLKMVSWRKI